MVVEAFNIRLTLFFHDFILNHHLKLIWIKNVSLIRCIVNKCKTYMRIMNRSNLVGTRNVLVNSTREGRSFQDFRWWRGKDMYLKWSSILNISDVCKVDIIIFEQKV